MKKRILSFFLALVLLLSMIPFGGMAYPAAYPLPELTGDQPSDLVKIAKSQEGYTFNDGTVYGAWWTGVTNWGVDYTREFWCAMFACWCADQAGVGMNLAYNKNGASCTLLYEWYRNNATYDASFSTAPQPGDFIFFGVDLSKVQHVAIVTGYDSSTGLVNFIGGNQRVKGGMVSAETCYWRSGAKFGEQLVLGYGRPKYTSTGTHTCDKGTYMYFEAVHPHRSCYKCSVCGKIWAEDGSANYYESCALCNRPTKPEFKTAIAAAYKPGQNVHFEWYTSINATHYNLYIDRKNQKGQWERLHNWLEANNGMDYPFDTGEYRCVLQACNSNFLEPGQADAYLYTNGDYVYFTVTCAHSYKAKVTKAATCTQKGVKTFTCSLCSHSYTEAIPAKGHSYGSWKTTKKATCTADGVNTSTCAGCGAKKTQSVPATGHNYGSWKTTRKATCTKTGLKSKTCTACGAKQKKTVAKIAHTYKKGRCTVCNKKNPKADFATIITQPKNAVAKKGKTAKITVKATGDGLKYTWYYARKGAVSWKKASSTKNVFSVKMASKWHGTKVYCVVRDKYGNKVKSKEVTLYQGSPAKITVQPKPITVVSGSTGKLTVKASGAGLKYSWYYMRKGASKYTKAGTTKNVFSVKMANKWHGTKVYCVVTDKYGVKVKSQVVTLHRLNVKKAAAGTWRSTREVLPSGQSVKYTAMTAKVTSSGAVTIKTTKAGRGCGKGTFRYDLVYEKVSGNTVYYRLENYPSVHSATYSISKNRLTIRLANGHKFQLSPK